MKIVPAILANNVDDFVFRLRQAESFADYVQVDLMDGVFVPMLGLDVKSFLVLLIFLKSRNGVDYNQ